MRAGVLFWLETSLLPRYQGLNLWLLCSCAYFADLCFCRFTFKLSCTCLSMASINFFRASMRRLCIDFAFEIDYDMLSPSSTFLTMYLDLQGLIPGITTLIATKCLYDD